MIRGLKPGNFEKDKNLVVRQNAVFGEKKKSDSFGQSKSSRQPLGLYAHTNFLIQVL